MKIDFDQPPLVMGTGLKAIEKFKTVTRDDVVLATKCVSEILSPHDDGHGFAMFFMDRPGLLAVMQRENKRERVREIVKRTGLVVRVAEKTWHQYDMDEDIYANWAIDSAMLNAATVMPEIPFTGEGKRFLKLKSGMVFSESDIEDEKGRTIRGGNFIFAVAGLKNDYRAANMIANVSAAVSEAAARNKS